MYSFHESTTKGFYFDSVFKKGNLEPTIFLALSPTRHLFLPQTTARLDYVIPQTRLELFLLRASVWATRQPATASPSRSRLWESLPPCSNWKIAFLPQNSPSKATGRYGRHTDVSHRAIPYWLYHLEQVIQTLRLGLLICKVYLPSRVFEKI